MNTITLTSAENDLMKTLDFKIDELDLSLLYHHTKFAYAGMNFENWCKECKKSYVKYVQNRKDVKTYSQYVNAQIISLTSSVF